MEKEVGKLYPARFAGVIMGSGPTVGGERNERDTTGVREACIGTSR
jgi:hypothetical protein